MQSEIWR